MGKEEKPRFKALKTRPSAGCDDEAELLEFGQAWLQAGDGFGH